MPLKMYWVEWKSTIRKAYQSAYTVSNLLYHKTWELYLLTNLTVELNQPLFEMRSIHPKNRTETILKIFPGKNMYVKKKIKTFQKSELTNDLTIDQTLNEVIFPVWAECFPGIFSMHNAQPETKLFCLSNNTFIFCMHIFQIYFFSSFVFVISLWKILAALCNDNGSTYVLCNCWLCFDKCFFHPKWKCHCSILIAS